MLAICGSDLKRVAVLALLTALLALAPASCGGGSGNDGEEQTGAQPAGESATNPAQPAGGAQQGAAANDADPPAPTDNSDGAQPSDAGANEPEAVVERFMTALKEARFEDAIALCDPNATGAFELRRLVDNLPNVRESAGDVVYTTAVSYLTASVSELTWKVMRVDENLAIVAYKGPRDDHDEAQFEVRLIDGRWLVAPPPEGVPTPKMRRR